MVAFAGTPNIKLDFSHVYARRNAIREPDGDGAVQPPAFPGRPNMDLEFLVIE